MAQLKMYRLTGTPFVEEPLPEGYTISNYKRSEDKLAWCECCKHGLVADDADEKTFDKDILEATDKPFEDVFFLDHNGEHIGTVTAFVRDDGYGDMHMVGIREDYRGRGLAKFLNYITIKHLESRGVPYTILTTDEWRKGAVKSYLSGGFLPVEYDVDMELRWSKVLEEYGIDSVQMLNEDATPYKIIYRTGLSKAE